MTVTTATHTFVLRELPGLITCQDCGQSANHPTHHVHISDTTHQCGRCSADVVSRPARPGSHMTVVWHDTDGLAVCSDGEPHAVDRMH